MSYLRFSERQKFDVDEVHRWAIFVHVLGSSRHCSPFFVDRKSEEKRDR